MSLGETPDPRESGELLYRCSLPVPRELPLVSPTAEPATQAPAVLPPEGILCQLLGLALLKALQPSNGVPLPTDVYVASPPGLGLASSSAPQALEPSFKTALRTQEYRFPSPGNATSPGSRCQPPQELKLAIPREYLPCTPHEHGASKGVAKNPNRAEECMCIHQVRKVRGVGVAGEGGGGTQEIGERVRREWGTGRAPMRAALRDPCHCWRERAASSARRTPRWVGWIGRHGSTNHLIRAE